MDKKCYFCGFNYVVDEHHIIERCNGGSNKKDNKIYLCPNHHTMFHRGIAKLIFFKGYYFLVYNKTYLIPVYYNGDKQILRIEFINHLKKMGVILE